METSKPAILKARALTSVPLGHLDCVNLIISCPETRCRASNPPIKFAFRISQHFATFASTDMKYWKREWISKWDKKQFNTNALKIKSV